MNVEHAYIAGFFDGEGCVHISRCKMGQYSDNHRLIIEIGQRLDHAALLYELAAEFGGSVRILHRSRKNPRWSDIAEWKLLKGDDQRRFLTAILPMLRVKRSQAELGLRFLDARQSTTLAPIRVGGASGNRYWAGTERLSDEQLAERESFRVAMCELNKQGHVRAAS